MDAKMFFKLAILIYFSTKSFLLDISNIQERERKMTQRYNKKSVVTIIYT